MHKKIEYWRRIFIHKYSQTEQGLVQVFEGWKPFLNFSLVFKKAFLLIYFTCICVLPVRRPCIVCMWCMQMLDKGMGTLELSTAVVAGNGPPGSFGRAMSALLLSHRQSLGAQITICCDLKKASSASIWKFLQSLSSIILQLRCHNVKMTVGSSL